MRFRYLGELGIVKEGLRRVHNEDSLHRETLLKNTNVSRELIITKVYDPKDFQALN